MCNDIKPTNRLSEDSLMQYRTMVCVINGMAVSEEDKHELYTILNKKHDINSDSIYAA